MVPLITLVMATPTNNRQQSIVSTGSSCYRAIPAPGYRSGQVIKALEEEGGSSLPQATVTNGPSEPEERLRGRRDPFELAFLRFPCQAACIKLDGTLCRFADCARDDFRAFCFVLRGLENIVYFKSPCYADGPGGEKCDFDRGFAKLRWKSMPIRQAAIEAANCVAPDVMTYVPLSWASCRWCSPPAPAQPRETPWGRPWSEAWLSTRH